MFGLPMIAIPSSLCCFHQKAFCTVDGRGAHGRPENQAKPTKTDRTEGPIREEEGLGWRQFEKNLGDT